MSATTNTPANALIVKQKTFKDLIEKAKSSIVDILPKHLSADRMARTMLLAMTRQPLLYECSVESILQAFLTCSELGLEPGGIRGYMYLVPFWNSRIKGYECQTIPGYRGLMHLAKSCQDISYITARVVHAADRFEAVYGLTENLVHEPCLDDNRGPAVCVYAVAHWRTGDKQFEIMTRSQIESIKSRSRSRDKNGNIVGPWVTDEDEMWRKTAIRRLMKYMELSDSLERAIDLDDAQYVAHRGPERASVNMTEMLNAPQERGPVIDIGAIRPAEPVVTDTEDPASDAPPGDLPWFEDDPEPAPPPGKPKNSKPNKTSAPSPPSIIDQADSIIADIRRVCGPQIDRAAIEAHIGLPVEQWTEAIVLALDGILMRLSAGESPVDVFPSVFGGRV